MEETAPMRICLLGPMRITLEGALVQVTAAKQRSLLAALAVRVGDVVPADSLAEAIWDSAPPASWQVTLRNYVKRLRNALGADAGNRIFTSPPGYVLQANRSEIDLFAFEELARAGLAAAAADSWLQASVKLAAAEALWRGTPFIDIPSQTVRDEQVPYLEELRLAALEARIDAEIRLSQFAAADAIPGLRRLTARHPARERLRGLLMLALYRTGRQADALTVFRQARKFSVDELGVEPGPDIKDLHQRILTADPSLLD
jgi:DNA-binding SARP family transcriptional activator